MHNESYPNQGGAQTTGGGMQNNGAPQDQASLLVQTLLGDLASNKARLMQLVAQKYPTATPQQLEALTAAMQAQLGAIGLAPAQQPAPTPAQPQQPQVAVPQAPPVPQPPAAPVQPAPAPLQNDLLMQVIGLLSGGVGQPAPAQPQAPVAQYPQYPQYPAQPPQPPLQTPAPAYPQPGAVQQAAAPQYPPQPAQYSQYPPQQPQYPPQQQVPAYPQAAPVPPAPQQQSATPTQPAPGAAPVQTSAPVAPATPVQPAPPASPPDDDFSLAPGIQAAQPAPQQPAPLPFAQQPAEEPSFSLDDLTQMYDEQRAEETAEDAKQEPAQPATPEPQKPATPQPTPQRPAPTQPVAAAQPARPQAPTQPQTAPQPQPSPRPAQPAPARPVAASAAPVAAAAARPVATAPQTASAPAPAKPEPQKPAPTQKTPEPQKPATLAPDAKQPAKKPEAPKSESVAKAAPAPVENLDNLASLAAAPEKLGEPVEISAQGGEAPDFNNLKARSQRDTKAPEDFLTLLGRHAHAAGVAVGASPILPREESTLERAKDDAPMWLFSFLLHIAIALLLAFIVTNSSVKLPFDVVSEPGFGDDVVLDDVFDPDASMSFDENVEFSADDAPEIDSTFSADAPEVSAFQEESAAPLSISTDDIGSLAPLGEADSLLGALGGDDLSGRGENKAAALASGGGSEGSEKSVALALSWLAEHQNPNGSWSYDLRYCPSCRGQCTHYGTNGSTTAATAMGILPFLAAGHTPTTGKYKRVVARGITYLMSQGQETENGLSFRDSPGTMYAHGLATITLCETWAMLSEKDRKKNRKLGYAAQSALHFIEYAQADNGGWRYSPKQAGDTSVFGWQMMALKSGQLAGLSIDDTVVFGARNFLKNVVAFDYERQYGYTGANQSPTKATSSIGLLCRLYLDWRVNNPTLIQGATRILGLGPDLNDPYYTYYAAQLMHNVGGAIWEDWNSRTRDMLVNAQCMEGHERGSWFPQNANGHCQTGGRLYATSFNCMVLEVYYRHMPLYQRMDDSTRFPLDLPAGVAPAEKKEEPAAEAESGDAENKESEPAGEAEEKKEGE